MINEAVYALYEGVGSVAGIDTSMRLGANHRWPAGIRGLHRAGYVSVDYAGAYEGLSDSKAPAVPAAGEVCRGRLAGARRSAVSTIHSDAAAVDAV
jgi:3-hydroxybutyryl-CoA dehydrogenase